MSNTDTVSKDGTDGLVTIAMLEREVATAEVEWSYHDDGHRYPREFWHARLTWRDFSSDWTIYGDQEQSILPDAIKHDAETELREQLRSALKCVFTFSQVSVPDHANKCGELVTVGYMVSHEGGLGIVEEPVCYRSQAESEIRKVCKDAVELLAEERVFSKNLMATYDFTLSRLDEAESDNWRKEDRIKELENELISLKNWIDTEPIPAVKALEDKLAAAEQALEATHEAISEYYRYQYGGEMRGSYDGKPERDGLWKAMYQARAVLGGKPS